MFTCSHVHIFTFLIALEGRSPNLSCALGWESQGDQNASHESPIRCKVVVYILLSSILVFLVSSCFLKTLEDSFKYTKDLKMNFV